MQVNTESDDALAFVIAFIFVTANFFAVSSTLNVTEKTGYQRLFAFNFAHFWDNKRMYLGGYGRPASPVWKGKCNNAKGRKN